MAEVFSPVASVDVGKSLGQPVIHWQPSPRRLDGYNLAANDWGAPHVRHLMTRASFGVAVDEVTDLLPFTKTQILNRLLLDEPLPAPPGAWVSEPFDPAVYRALPQEEKQAWQRRNRLHIEETRGWWVLQMAARPFNLREKMTLFWHGHFTSEFDTVQLAQWVFMQNDTLRRHALGNFRDFLKAIYKDPAMLIYLDGVRNVARQPNENFARELLELFSLGVGNYTENDIKEAARAFTGWQIDSRNIGKDDPSQPVAALNTRQHDSDLKTFFGKSGNFGGDEIIDLILEQPAAAEFICTKLYKFFVSHEVDKAFVTQLADIFRQNDYAIKPVLQALFESEHFYSDHAVASLIKSPIELAVNNVRLLKPKRVTPIYLVRAATSLDQELLNPPNVAGWPGQRSWINATSLVTRNVFSETYIMGGTIENPGNARQTQIEVDAMALARSFGVNKAADLIEAFTTHLLRYPIDEATRDFLITVLVGSADPDDWSLDYPGADTQVKQCLVQIMRLPEFQLM
jgi:uncharacterized protein (DUF1800 family)